MPKKPHVFEHFPKDEKCPICNTNEDGECLLIQIDYTAEGNISEAALIHLWCAIATNLNLNVGVVCRKTYAEPQLIGGK